MTDSRFKMKRSFIREFLASSFQLSKFLSPLKKVLQFRGPGATVMLNLAVRYLSSYWWKLQRLGMFDW